MNNKLEKAKEALLALPQSKAIERAIKSIQEKIDEKNESGWYKHTNGEFKKWLVYLDEDGSGYGTGTTGDWITDHDFKNYIKNDCEPATNKEVESMLIKEAKRRGFKEGVLIKSPIDGDEYMGHGDMKFDSGNSYLALGNSVTLFDNGKWAEIIENKLTINGEVMKQDGDIISFGCAKFHVGWFQSFVPNIERLNDNYRATTNRKISSITLDSGVTLTIEDLKEIVDNIK